MIHNCLAGGFNLVSQSVFAEESQLHAKHHFDRAFVENVRSVSCWLHSAHTVLNGRKGFVVTRAQRRLRRQLCGGKKSELDGLAQLSTINTTIPVCLFVCAALLLLTALLHLPQAPPCLVWTV